MTREELTKRIAEQKAFIAKLQADAQQAFAQLNANMNNQIGRCEGRIEVFEAELKELNGPAAYGSEENVSTCHGNDHDNKR